MSAPVAAAPPAGAAPAVRSVSLSTGVRLPYVERGDPGGVPVVFLHGFPDSWRSWERVLPLLPPSVRAFAPTQRGHGDADRPPGAYRTRDFAADIAAFLDAVGIEAAVLVGHSMGATNALRFAADFPDRTLGLVLEGAIFPFRANADLVAYWQDEIVPLQDPIAPDFARDFQASTLARPMPPDYFETIVRESLKLPARVWRAVWDGLMEDDLGELGRIASPTLLAWGERDAFALRADQDAILAAVPGARLAVYPGAGHSHHWEDPAPFAAEVAAFAAEVGG